MLCAITVLLFIPNSVLLFPSAVHLWDFSPEIALGGGRSQEVEVGFGVRSCRAIGCVSKLQETVFEELGRLQEPTFMLAENAIALEGLE